MGSREKNAGLAENDAEMNAPKNKPNGAPVNSRKIAVDSYESTNICVNPSIAIGSTNIPAIANTARVRRFFL